MKVQRPEARQTVADDLESMAEIADFLDTNTDLGRRYQFSSIVEEFRKSLLQELDYRIEAGNLRVMRESLKEFERILIPEPVEDYSSGRVLTMEFVSGAKITKISPLAKLEIDGPELAEELFRAYLHQILVKGFFHADPHPGNVFLTDDGRIGLLDLGMVGRLGQEMQAQLLKLLLAISEGQSDRAVAVAEKMGKQLEDYDGIQFHRRVADLVMQQQAKTLDNIEVGKVVLEIQKISGDCKLRVPAELTLLGKTLLNLDLVGKTLSPEFDPNESIRRNAAKILHERTVKGLAPGNLLSVLLEAKEFVEQMPSRLNTIFELAATNKLRIKVESFNENLIVATLQKIANRITMGLILAAMIVGASLLMRVETTFHIFGYPGFAMILFLLAFIGGGALAVQILRSDMAQKK